MRRAGYVIVGIAESSAGALASAFHARPDFALVDVRLSDVAGGVYAAIELRRRFNIPTIFYTANDDDRLRLMAAEAEPLGWIIKPVSPSALVMQILELRSAV